LDESHEDSTDEFSSDPESLASEVEASTGATPPVPRTGHVSSKLRRQIEKGEYIKMSLLEPKDPSDSRPPRFSFNPNSGQFEQMEEKKKFSFSQWRRCYITFMSLRMKAFPEEGQGLLRHLEIVEDLQRQGLDGVRYDAQFRETKAQHPSIRWGQYMADLVIAGLTPTTAPRLSVTRRPNSRVCSFYNSVEGCLSTRCRFAHACDRCNQPGHPAHKCYAQTSVTPQPLMDLQALKY
jgi:hypothetical protein